MEIFFYILSRTALALVRVTEVVMFVRAIIEWIAPDSNGRIYSFTVMVTEPILMPARVLLDKFEFTRNFPIDLSFLLTYIVLAVIGALLGALI